MKGKESSVRITGADQTGYGKGGYATKKFIHTDMGINPTGYLLMRIRIHKWVGTRRKHGYKEVSKFDFTGMAGCIG